MIVCADADIDRAADGAVWGAFTFTGQACISVERCYARNRCTTSSSARWWLSTGARVLVGGQSSDPATEGLIYQPTVLVDVDHGMQCMREETFGPTLPVMKVRDVAEAIEKANDSPLGLSGMCGRETRTRGWRWRAK
jgi:acyl-CoA reductase-like NAD-dependent aldehyde dehydrogenase